MKWRGVVSNEIKMIVEESLNHPITGFVIYASDNDRTISSFWHEHEAIEFARRYNTHDQHVARIAELEFELKLALTLIDDGDKYSSTDIGYLNSPYCADVREFLFTHGLISEEERPKLTSAQLLEQSK